MSNIILQPTGDKIARKNYKNTIENKVSLKDIKSFLSEDDYKKIISIYPNEKFSVWGVRNGVKDGTKKRWKKIKPGDVALFAQDSMIYSTAVVTLTLENRDLATYLWGVNENNETWENIYLLDELSFMELPVKELNYIVGYSENNNIQRFTYLDDDKSDKLFNILEIMSNSYFEDVSEEDFKEAVLKLNKIDNLDGERSSSFRKEQSYLRKLLFRGKKVFNCGICGKEYPIDMLVTAHIKRRCDCKNEERLDVNNIIMPMCKCGCDDLYEKGYLLVIDGIIKKNPNKYFTRDLETQINKICEKECVYWNKETKKYFMEHNKRFMKE